jgi:hypothetical protein
MKKKKKKKRKKKEEDEDSVLGRRPQRTPATPNLDPKSVYL